MDTGAYEWGWDTSQDEGIGYADDGDVHTNRRGVNI